MLGYLFLLVLVASVFGFFFNRFSARREMRRGVDRFRSMDLYHGVHAVFLTGLPALLFALFFLAFQGAILDAVLVASLPADVVGTVPFAETYTCGVDVVCGRMLGGWISQLSPE